MASYPGSVPVQHSLLSPTKTVSWLQDSPVYPLYSLSNLLPRSVFLASSPLVSLVEEVQVALVPV